MTWTRHLQASGPLPASREWTAREVDEIGRLVDVIEVPAGGSTRLLTDAAGVEVGSYRYEAYGLQLEHTGTATTPLRYAGQYSDDETGYQYLRARYYDPATASFLTRDPIAALTRLPYGYTGGNPLNYYDPTGLSANPVDWVKEGVDLGKDLLDLGGQALQSGAILAQALTFFTARAMQDFLLGMPGFLLDRLEEMWCSFERFLQEEGWPLGCLLGKWTPFAPCPPIDQVFDDLLREILPGMDPSRHMA